MSLVQFRHNPVIEDGAKPTALANQGYPYDMLPSARRFEEFIYSVTKHKLGHGLFKGFDTVSLMTGVRDKGQDCALFKAQKLTGIIQCKQYEKNYGKKDFGIEITKFILYTILDQDLKIDRENFCYFIAVSGGFVKNCSDFIDQFNTKIMVEPDLPDWVQKNIQNPELAQLKLKDGSQLLNEVRAILSKIKVEKLVRQDYDIFLGESNCHHLIPLFFDVRVMVDNSKVEEIGNQLEKLFTTKIGTSKIEKSLERSSIRLSSEKNEFDEIPNSHIERKETDQLFDWVVNESPKDIAGNPLNLCLLAGDAGMGKTVILKDLLSRLKSEKIPVLGLKADRVTASNLKELEDKIQLPTPLHDFIESCKELYPLTVILIDQIDALSQSMSSDRNFIQVYKDIIESYKYDVSVKIVVSVRIFDLNFDPSLKVYSNIHSIQVAPLSEENVKEQLAKIGIGDAQISSTLLKLLRTPNNLNVFAQIRGNNASLNLTSLHGMYGELWRQKINNLASNGNIEKRRLKELLYRISQKMFRDQRIAVGEIFFDDFSSEISFLESHKILTRLDGQLQFFHQTFYDFVFAKQFVENEGDLLSFVKTQQQSLLIRSAFKMIISFLRENDPELYRASITNLLDDQDILFHLKHLAFSLIVSYQEPTDFEESSVLELISHSIAFNTLFLEQASSEQWLRFSIKHDLFDCLRGESKLTFNDLTPDEKYNSEYLIYWKNSTHNFLKKFVKQNNSDAYRELEKIEDQRILRSMLFSVDDWQDNSRAIALFEKCDDFEASDPHAYYHILENIAKVDHDYVINKISVNLFSRYSQDDLTVGDYSEKTLLKTLGEECTEKLALILFDLLLAKLDSENNIKNELISHYIFSRIDLFEKEELPNRAYLYQLLAVCLKRLAISHPDAFLSFAGKIQKSKHDCAIRLLIFAIKTNEQLYPDLVFDLFYHLSSFDNFFDNKDIGVEYRQLLEQGFVFLSAEQKLRLTNSIGQLAMHYDIRVWTDAKGRSHYRVVWDLSKYFFMKIVPKNVLTENKELYNQFQELDRKHHYAKEKDIRKSILSAGYSAPIPKEAFDKMKAQHWLASFKKYGSSYEPDRWGDDRVTGGMREHAHAFKESVKDNLSFAKKEAIKLALMDSSINIAYPLLGLVSWSEFRDEYEDVLPLFKQLLKTANSGDDKRYLISMAEQLVRGRSECDGTVVDFLIAHALNFNDDFQGISEPDKIETSYLNGLVFKAINTLSGSAAQALPFIQDPNFEQQVFNCVDELFRNGPKELKAVLFFRFAYLTNLNRDLATEMFTKYFNAQTTIQVQISSLWSLQYFGGDSFEGLKPGYDRMIKSPKLGREDSNNLFMLLYSFYLHDLPGSESLLFKFLNSDPERCSNALYDVSKHYNDIPDTKEKSNKILNYIIDTADEYTFDSFDWRFNRHTDFSILDAYEILVRYVESPYFSNSEEFISYLTKQLTVSPKKAIDLFHLAVQSKAMSSKNDGWIRRSDRTSRFIVSSYSTLRDKTDETLELKKKLLESFDIVLYDFRHRFKTEEILEQLN